MRQQQIKILGQSYGWGTGLRSHPAVRRDQRRQAIEGLTEGPKAGIERWGTQEAQAKGSGELGAQESLDSRIDVPSCGDQGL